MVRRLAALAAGLLACGHPAPPPAGGAAGAAPPAPVVAAAALGNLQPLPYRKQLLVHVDDQAAALHRGGDPVGCGRAYVARYNQHPEAADADQVLFDAAECFAEGKSVGAAIAARRLLIKDHPRSRFVPDALLATARTYASIAYYDRAAATYVDYASRFATRDDAPQALVIAARYRLALGDGDGARAAAARFAASYGRSMAGPSAALELQVVAATAAAGDPAAALAAWLHRYPDAPVEARVEAHVRLAQALLARSCPVKPPLGDLCVTVRTGRLGHGEPPRCGPEEAERWQVQPRDPGLLARARAELSAAVELAPPRRGGAAAADQTALDYWGAAAGFHAAELQAEAFLGIEFPAHLDFSGKRRTDSMKRFSAYVAAVKAAGTRAASAYRAVLDHGNAGLFWGVRVAERNAELRLRMAGDLLDAPIPADVRAGAYADDKEDAYCDTLAGTAMPIEDKAIVLLRSCAELASAGGWYDAWTRRCVDQLAALRPLEFPAVDEVYRAADDDGVRVAGGDQAALEQEVARDPKALAPRLALGALLLGQRRSAGDGDAARAIDADARRHLASALAVAPADVTARVLLALLYLEGGDDNANRLLLARLLLDEAREIDPRSALVANARGVMLARRGALGDAAGAFEDALALDPGLAAARRNAAAASLALRRWDSARDHYQAAVAVDPSSYDALIGLGVALRGGGDAAAAEAAYRRALQLDADRGEAPFDLGVLVRNVTAATAADLVAGRAGWEQSAQWFEQAARSPASPPALRARAAEQARDAREVIHQLDDVIEMQRTQGR